MKIPARFLEQLQEDPAVKAVLAETAEEAKRIAEQVAPRSSGAYSERFVVNGTSLGNTDPAAHIIEWGSSDTRPHGTLRKAVAAVGARWVDR
jgi:hypothetical protein